MRRPAASRPAVSPNIFLYFNELAYISRSPLASSTFNDRLSAVFFRKYIKIFFTLIKLFFNYVKLFYSIIMDSRTIYSATSSATTPAASVLTVDSSSSIVVDSTSSSIKVDSSSASAAPSVITVTDSDAPEPAMAVLHTIASSGDDGAGAGLDDDDDDVSDTVEHIEQIDPSSDELEILEAESVAAAAAVAAADARLRFLRARRTSTQVSQASARSTRSAPGPAVRPLWLPHDLPDRGPLATVPRLPLPDVRLPIATRPQRPAHGQDRAVEDGSLVARRGAVEVGTFVARSSTGRTVPAGPPRRQAVEPPRRAALRRQEEREEMWERQRRDQEHSRLLEERRSADRVIPYHLSGQRALEASGVDFAGNVVVPEIPPVVNIGDRVRVPKDDPSYDMLHASSDRSSVVARLRHRIIELEGNFAAGLNIPVPDNSSGFATASSADDALRPFPTTERDHMLGFEGPFSEFERQSLDALHKQDDQLQAGVDVPPGLAAADDGLRLYL